jgi:hypothetical protein
VVVPPLAASLVVLVIVGVLIVVRVGSTTGAGVVATGVVGAGVTGAGVAGMLGSNRL